MNQIGPYIWINFQLAKLPFLWLRSSTVQNTRHELEKKCLPNTTLDIELQ